MLTNLLAAPDRPREPHTPAVVLDLDVAETALHLLETQPEAAPDLIHRLEVAVRADSVWVMVTETRRRKLSYLGQRVDLAGVATFRFGEAHDATLFTYEQVLDFNAEHFLTQLADDGFRPAHSDTIARINDLRFELAPTRLDALAMYENGLAGRELCQSFSALARRADRHRSHI